ncbi:MAG: hypothetical protein ABSA01_15270 [Anaerolineales bacterium]|jgi:hypothetical protein
MNSTKKFWIVLTGTVLAMVIIACSCNSLTPALNPTATPTVIPQTATAIVPPTQTPVSNPLPDLAGFWQDWSRVFTIEWQGNQYVVTAITAAGTSKRTLTSQSWDGKSLTWTYEYSDENGSSSNTYTTVSVNGDSLTVKYSSTNGTADTHTLKRVPSVVPVYDSLPYQEDFSNPGTGWDVYSNDNSSAGYENGYYFVTAKKAKINYYGEAYLFFDDTILDVDATPVSGPANNNFSSSVFCRLQSNGDGYLFEISGDGYFAVGTYTGGGKTYASLLSGDEWQRSNAIKTAMATNHINVTCAGNQLKLEVNGEVLFGGQDSTFTEGDIALGATTYDSNNAPAEVHFDNLAVSAP